eukprot:13281897-Alexandrium_andersonii.AAC.1
MTKDMLIDCLVKRAMEEARAAEQTRLEEWRRALESFLRQDGVASIDAFFQSVSSDVVASVESALAAD